MVSRDARPLPKPSPTPWVVAWDDGSLPLSNAATQLAVTRAIAGDEQKQRLGGLETTLHRSSVSEALVFNDPQPAKKLVPIFLVLVVF